MESNRILDALIPLLHTLGRKPPRTNGTVFVCCATAKEWSVFIDDETLPVKANFLQWFAETSEIHIVEFGTGQTHEVFRFCLMLAFTTDLAARSSLACRGGSWNSQGPAFLPKLCYGPRRAVPGALLPPGVPDWCEFNTIKVEIGVFQQWGHALGQLDHKAEKVWARMPGVQYVLCFKLSDCSTEAHFKLLDVVSNEPAPQFTVQADPVAIVPGTVVCLDARRVLGIPVTGLLPEKFPDPLVVDLYAVVQEARDSIA